MPVNYKWNPDNSFSFEVCQGEPSIAAQSSQTFTDKRCNAPLPPLAWSHTLAGRGFGALVTETGAGYCFRQNARENKMTPWTNDPLAVGGATRMTASIGETEISLFAANDGLPCTVTYGFGWARWVKTVSLPDGEVTLTTIQFVPPDRMALVSMVSASRSIPLTVSCVTEPLMGFDNGRLCVVERCDGFTRVTNPFNKNYAPQAFLIIPSPGQQGKALLIMGCTRNKPGEALLHELCDWDRAQAALERTQAYWEKLVRPVTVKSGCAALDHYGNGWALYQVIATRLLTRTSLYQCGGAYGFRDQLQDVCAALRAEPGFTRTQILRACARQYTEGDVMHWWHPANPVRGFSDKGVRTRCSDDLLWLPYTVAEYFEKTGDEALLGLCLPFLSSPPLAEGEDDRYESAAVTVERSSVYEHCLRAFACVRGRGTGANGLLLMGGGDWNDGMNLVGHKGKGESVWLTWFAAHTAQRFAPLCRRMGDSGNADMLTGWADALIAAASEAWDGNWFYRGTYDDGTLLGSSENRECQIDSIAQSFSALFPGKVPPERVRKALESASARLVDKDTGLVKLFDPPFSGRGAKNPGYIKGYVPGVRENGGQYTHAAVWLAMAFLKTGDRELCLDILEMLLPETHDNAVYKAEPHVLAADVYSHPGHIGRGGWSHYTGAASWFYRVLLDALGM